MDPDESVTDAAGAGAGEAGYSSTSADDASDAAPALSALPPDLAAVLTAFLEVSAALADAVTAGVASGDLDGAQAAVVAAGIAREASRLGVVGARLLPVIEADGMWALGDSRSFPFWVARTHRVSVRAARAQVRLGRALRDDLPATATAGVAGEVTLEQAQLLASLAPTTDLRRQALADPDYPGNESFLVAQAKALPVDSLRLVVRHWAAVVDPDADDRGYREATDREFVECTRDLDGYHLAGHLTLDNGQALLEALHAVTPVPALDDTRTSGQRRAQALGDLARLTLDNGLAGKGRSVRPRINVMVGLQTLEARAARVEDERERRESAGPELPAFTPALVTGHHTTADEAERLGPRYEDGTPLPRALLDRLMCDSEIARIVFGPDSEILDVGRAKRTFDKHLRTAIIARDKHCQYPTCTAPPALSECHHVQHWARDHGDTSVANGVLLCHHHHSHVHRRGIEIHRDGDRWVFTDAHGTPIDPDRDVARG